MVENTKIEVGTVQKIGDQIKTRGVPTFIGEDGKKFVVNPPYGYCDCCHRDIDDLPDYDVGNPPAILHEGTKLMKTFLNDSPNGDSSISAYWLCDDCINLVDSDEFYKKRDRCFEDTYKHQVLLEIPDNKKKEIVHDAMKFEKKYLVKDRGYYNTFFNVEGLDDNLSFDEGTNLKIHIRSTNKENIEEFLEYFSDKWNIRTHEVVSTTPA